MLRFQKGVQFALASADPHCSPVLSCYAVYDVGLRSCSDHLQMISYRRQTS